VGAGYCLLVIAVVVWILLAEPILWHHWAKAACDARLREAEGFFESMYDPSLQLYAEAPGVAPNTYWLVSDNLLAWKALGKAEVKDRLIELADKHNLPQNAEGLPISYKHETIIGETIPLPFRKPNYYLLEVVDGKEVKIEIANGTVMADWEEYADLLLYASLSRYNEGNSTGARYYFQKASGMWDGKGLADKEFRQSGRYTTFKLALLLYVSKRLGEPFEAELEEQIWERQHPVLGGFVTHYHPNGTNLGDVNTETTSLVIISDPAFRPARSALALDVPLLGAVALLLAIPVAVYRLYRWLKLKREEKERVFDYVGM